MTSFQVGLTEILLVANENMSRHCGSSSTR